MKGNLLNYININSKAHPITEEKHYITESDPGMFILVLKYNLIQSELTNPRTVTLDPQSKNKLIIVVFLPERLHMKR